MVCTFFFFKSNVIFFFYPIKLKKKKMKHYADCLNKIDAKRVKHNATLDKLEDRVVNTKKILDTLNDSRKKIAYRLNHPLYSFFLSMSFPESLVDICCSFATMDYCASLICEVPYPSKFGCIYCLKRYCNIIYECEPQKVTFLKRNPTSWEDIVLEVENDIEVWNYLTEYIIDDDIQNFSFRHVHNSNNTLEFNGCLKLSVQFDRFRDEAERSWNIYIWS